MKTSTKVTIAAAAALLAGAAAIGVSQADSYGGGRYFGGHHGKGMGSHDMWGSGGKHGGLDAFGPALPDSLRVGPCREDNNSKVNPFR